MEVNVEVIHEHPRCVERIRLYIERNEDCTGLHKLSFVPLKEDLTVCELCSRFIDPFLSGLFDNPNQGIYLRWTNESTLEGILGIHIIGRTIWFYVVVLLAIATYAMYLLAETKAPDSIQGFPGLVAELPSVLKILHICDTVCVHSITPNVIASRRAPTLSSRACQQIKSESKSRKRACHLYCIHN